MTYEKRELIRLLQTFLRHVILSNFETRVVDMRAITTTVIGSSTMPVIKDRRKGCSPGYYNAHEIMIRKPRRNREP